MKILKDLCLFIEIINSSLLFVQKMEYKSDLK